MWGGLGFIFFVGMIIFIVRAYKTKKQKTGRIIKPVLFAIGCFLLSSIFYSKDPKYSEDTSKQSSSTSPKQEVKKSDAKPVAATDETKKKEETQKVIEEQDKKAVEAQTKADEEAAAKKKAADEKSTQQAELAALGDWSIKSNADDFSNRYAKIQQYIAAGDRQSAYDEATMASKRADDLNSKTMNNQNMANVPKDIPSEVRNVLNGVDSLLATGYMSEKDGFDKLADAINTNDLSKLNDAKDDFAVANDQFKQAKSLIDKANGMLR